MEIGPYGRTWASCHPVPADQVMVTMGSVNVLPKPGLANTAERRSAGMGAGLGEIENSRVSTPVMGRTLPGVLIGGSRLCGADEGGRGGQPATRAAIASPI